MDRSKITTEQLLKVLDQSPAVTYVAESVPDYAALFISNGVRGLLGYQPEDLTGSPSFWVSRVHPEDRSRVFEELERLTGSGQTAIEYRFQHADGGWRWLRDESRLLKNGHAGEDRIVGTLTDVTERVAVEDELRYARQQFETIVDQSIQGVIIHRYLEPVYVNFALAEMLGYRSREEVLALGSMERIYAPHEHRRLHEYQRARLAGGDAPSRYEFDAVREDGSLITVETYVRRIHWNGQIATQHHLADVTERKCQVRALEESERMRRLVTDNLPVAIALVDSTCRVIFLNPQARDWHRVRGEGYIGMHLSELMGEQAFREVKPVMDEALCGARVEVEQHRVFRDGTTRDLHLIYAPQFDSDGRVVGFLAAGMDISERRRVEEQIRTSRENLRRLLQRIESIREEERRQIGLDLHDDVGQKLTALRLIASRMIDQNAPEPNDGRDMLNMIDQLFEMTRRLSNRLRPHVLETLGLEDALRTHLKEVAGQAKIKTRLRVELPRGRLPEGHELNIFRIVQEAVTNAVRHARARRVDISLRVWLKGILVEIVDDGVGISKDAVPSGSG
ncbi:MAG: PAS domain S-box protein, partial [Gammaproteobacteria bacterium]|nr:PAS domain S-box protein [Gammaproteobacteria bacterium]